jgi:acyl-CoA synthetase (AMP-forming)/AMP-acid ligase II
MAGYAQGHRYRGATLVSMLDDIVRRHPTRDALVCPDRRLAYTELVRDVERCARSPRAGRRAGRLKETLRIGRQMVAPAEIKAFPMHPGVAQAFVVGAPDPRLGEVAVAYVIPRPGATPTETEVITDCRSRLAGRKVPRHVFIVPDVPRTPGPHGDQVQRAQLRADALRLGAASAHWRTA